MRTIRERIPPPRPNTATITFDCTDKQYFTKFLDPELVADHSQNQISFMLDKDFF